MAAANSTQTTLADAIEKAEFALSELEQFMGQAWAAATALDEHHSSENRTFHKYMSAIAAQLLDEAIEPQERLRTALESIRTAAKIN